MPLEGIFVKHLLQIGSMCFGLVPAIHLLGMVNFNPSFVGNTTNLRMGHSYYVGKKTTKT